MKRIVFLTVIFLTQVFAQSDYRVVTVERKSNINRDVEEFVKLLPAEDISAVVHDYAKNDQEVKKNWEYLQSKDVQIMVNDIGRSKEFGKIRDQIMKTNLKVQALMQHFYNILSTPSSLSPPRSSPGLRGLLLGSIKPLIPMASIQRLATQKYIFSSEFRQLVKIVTSKEFKGLVLDLVASDSVKRLESDAVNNGKIDVKSVYEFVASFEFLYEYLMDL